MADTSRKRTCFVVMPFGDKKDLDGQDIDFNDIYEYFFKKTIEGLDIVCTRCDEIGESGSIHEKMIQQIYQSDIVAVDITTSNANVYYELGIRHALAKGVTLLIRRKGTTIPFNIQGLQVVEYDQSRFRSIEAAKDRIHEIIKLGLRNRKNDSPVHSVLDLNIEPEPKPLGETRFLEARLVNASDVLCVGLVTGDIQNVTQGIDVWVNVENTFMQMGRIFDNSISGIVRYWGGRDPSGEFRDTIAHELRAKLSGRTSVNPAEVLVTSSGSMLETHKVKRIFHVAANYGQIGKGYLPIDDIASCVANILKEGKNASGKDTLTSVLFPLMGTKSRRGSIMEDRVKLLLDSAVDYLASNPKSTFRKVYFLAYTDRELDTCRNIMENDNRLQPLKEINQTGEGPVAETRVSGSSGPGSIVGSFDRGATFATPGTPSTPLAARSENGTGPSARASAQKKPPKQKRALGSYRVSS